MSIKVNANMIRSKKNLVLCIGCTGKRFSVVYWMQQSSDILWISKQDLGC